jgi:hypothetical protein
MFTYKAIQKAIKIIGQNEVGIDINIPAEHWNPMIDPKAEEAVQRLLDIAVKHEQYKRHVGVAYSDERYGFVTEGLRWMSPDAARVYLKDLMKLPYKIILSITVKRPSGRQVRHVVKMYR